jgi:3-deoxy-D-manno-octulosonate 8-phosphate phosphatase (KDO 8-P phosphatase)
MIEMLVFDVDGCLTDGKITYTENLDEIKSFNVKDGLAIVTWINMGKKAVIITGRESGIVSRRAEELKITHIYQGVRYKKQKLDEILEKEGFGYDEVAVIGDDLNDYYMLTSTKHSFAPQNAVKKIKDSVSVVLDAKGGEGAVREMIEIIVEKEGLSERFLKQWL